MHLTRRCALCCVCTQNFLRSCGGANTHPTISECLSRASGRTMRTVLSKSANNGLRGGKKARSFDEGSEALPLQGRKRAKTKEV
jgi:hypothetical protein